METNDRVYLLLEIEKLNKEIKRLQDILNSHGISYELSEEDIASMKQQLAPVKITIEHARFFYSLFKGRRDVYALRNINKNGKAVYYTQCKNFWKYGVCPKRDHKKVKCGECENRQFIPLGQKAIEAHLRGVNPDCKDVIGMYLTLPDETCSVLVFDFDNHDDVGLLAESEGNNEGLTWIEEVNVMRKICKDNDVPAYVERSRSGKGAHIWLFFSDPINVAIARRFGSALLTKGAESVSMKTFSYYDRMIPNQDHLPAGGLGNLIALPLQGRALLRGNSAFIDENWQVYSDQWTFLTSVKRIPKSFVEESIEKWCKHGELGALSVLRNDDDNLGKPWKKVPVSFTAKDVDGVMEITISNQIFVRSDNLEAIVQNSLRRLAAFSNPNYFKQMNMGYSVYGVPRIINCAYDDAGYICLPRGKQEELEQLLKSVNVKYQLTNLCQVGKPIDVTFNGCLYPEQQAAVDELLKYDYGILHAATAFGKTVVGAYVVAERKVNTLILVHNREILNNWVKDLDKFLNINEEVPVYYTKTGRMKKRKSIIGSLYAGHDSTNGLIDVAMISSLGSEGEVNDIVKNYGLVIMDECHHAAANTYDAVLREVSAKYLYGFTATLKRDDGMEQKVLMRFGPVRYRYSAKQRAEKQGIEHIIYPRFTRLQNIGEPWKINDAYSNVIKAEERNEQIVGDVFDCLDKGRTPIIITRFREHAELLFNMLISKTEHVLLLHGGRSSKDREKIRRELESIPYDEKMVVVAIGKYIGEGFNLPRLDTMMLATPISFEGNVEQYSGRLQRDFLGIESAIIYEYVDSHVPVLEKMYHKRMRTYKKIGYEIGVPGIYENKCTSIIFDKHNFQEAFRIDLSMAKDEIIVASPILSNKSVKEFINYVKVAQYRGARVSVLTLDVDRYNEARQEQIALLHKQLAFVGIYVKCFASLHECFAIIDNDVLWYGNLNMLSGGKEEDTLVRLKDKSAIGEVLDMFSRNK